MIRFLGLLLLLGGIFWAGLSTLEILKSSMGVIVDYCFRPGRPKMLTPMRFMRTTARMMAASPVCRNSSRTGATIPRIQPNPDWLIAQKRDFLAY